MMLRFQMFHYFFVIYIRLKMDNENIKIFLFCEFKVRNTAANAAKHIYNMGIILLIKFHKN